MQQASNSAEFKRGHLKFRRDASETQRQHHRRFNIDILCMTIYLFVACTIGFS